MKRRAMICLILICALLISAIPAMADEDKKILNMSADERQEMFTEIVVGVLNNDTSVLNKYNTCINTDVFTELSTYSLKGGVSEEVSVNSIVYEWIEVENSTTKDNVVMVNTKVWKEEATYNEIHTFEFHVNKEGKIYGYNLWVH